MQRYFQSLRPRVHERAVAVAAAEDLYVIWAKSLIEDLKKVKSENKRTVLQIKMNRLVHNEILTQIEQETGETL